MNGVDNEMPTLVAVVGGWCRDDMCRDDVPDIDTLDGTPEQAVAILTNSDFACTPLAPIDTAMMLALVEHARRLNTGHVPFVATMQCGGSRASYLSQCLRYATMFQQGATTASILGEGVFDERELCRMARNYFGTITENRDVPGAKALICLLEVEHMWA